MSSAFGLRWAEPIFNEGELLTVEGILPRASRLTYSLDGPHYIELIEHVDATAWCAVPGGPNVHHIGAHAADLRAEVERLESLGFVVNAATEVVDATHGYSFLRHPQGGLWVELVGDEVYERVMAYIERNRRDKSLS